MRSLLTTDAGGGHGYSPSHGQSHSRGHSHSRRHDHLAYTLLLVGLVLAVVEGYARLASGPAAASAPAFEQTIAQALDDDARPRLLRTRLTDWGDLDVELALRDLGGAQANRAAALADTLRIARAVYGGPQPPPSNLTVVGLATLPAPAEGTVSVLYASLPADRLVGVDWGRLAPDDLARLGGVRWLPGGECQAWRAC